MQTATDLEQTAHRPRSRRALLAGAMGGLGAWLVAAAQRATPAEAGAGDPILAGRTTSAGGTSTELRANTNQPTFRAVQVGGGAAIRAQSTSGRAVMATAGASGTGVHAFSPDYNAVYAKTDSGYAVLADVTDGKSGVALRARTNGPNATAVEAIATGIDSFALTTEGPTELAGGNVDVERNLTVGSTFSLRNQNLTPDALPDIATLFIRETVGGTLELAIRFPTGAVQVLAAEA